MIVKSLTSLEITEMMKRHQHITKLKSELIKEKKFIDCKLDKAIGKHCYLEKSKYELLPQIVIPKIPSHQKFTKVDKLQTQYYKQYPSHHLTHHQKEHHITS